MLDINIEFRKGILFIRLEGILNYETVYKLNEEVLNTIKTNGIKFIVFNLENLCSIDLEGIKAIMNHYNTINSYNGLGLICGITSNIVKKIIKENNVLSYLKETTNELSALKLIDL